LVNHAPPGLGGISSPLFPRPPGFHGNLLPIPGNFIGNFPQPPGISPFLKKKSEMPRGGMVNHRFEPHITTYYIKSDSEELET
jgi:hypothetical protein